MVTPEHYNTRYLMGYSITDQEDRELMNRLYGKYGIYIPEEVCQTPQYVPYAIEQMSKVNAHLWKNKYTDEELQQRLNESMSKAHDEYEMTLEQWRNPGLK